MGAYVAPLTALGYQVITWDNPAHGDAEGKQSSPWLFARSILAVAEKVGTPHVVIGHSMGALATNLALRHGLRAERLVYLAPGGAPEQGLELMQTRLNVTQATLDVLQPLIAQAAGVTWPDLVLGLVPSDCKTPLLVVHDEDDEEVPISFSERLTQDWAGPVSLVRTQGLGHQRVVWDKNAVQAVADALDRADAVAG